MMTPTQSVRSAVLSPENERGDDSEGCLGVHAQWVVLGPPNTALANVYPQEADLGLFDCSINPGRGALAIAAPWSCRVKVS